MEGHLPTARGVWAADLSAWEHATRESICYLKTEEASGERSPWSYSQTQYTVTIPTLRKALLIKKKKKSLYIPLKWLLLLSHTQKTIQCLYWKTHPFCALPFLLQGIKLCFFYSTNKDFRRVVNYLLMELEEECVIIPQNSEMYIANFMPTCV